MGFLDNLSDAFNSAASTTSRGAKMLKLKGRIGEVNNHRSDLAAQLGASLYEATKDLGQYRIGRETLYDGIAECDRQRDQLQMELSKLEAEAATEAQAQRNYACQKCGNVVKDTDTFCSCCGKPVCEIKAEFRAAEDAAARQHADEVANTIICPNCGARVKMSDTFCMTCGTSLADAPANPATEPVTPMAEVSTTPAASPIIDVEPVSSGDESTRA